MMLLVMACLSMNASTWKMHNYYVVKKVQSIYDTGDKVYYVNSNHLFQFDKATSTTVALNKQNILSDNQIQDIYYDWQNKLLFIAYLNSNIDVIDAQGKVTNISNLKDRVAVVQNYVISSGDLSSYTPKTIKDITFAGGMAYVALGYGYATIDESTMRVTRNVDLGRSVSINSVSMMGDTLVIVSNNRCYYGNPTDPKPLTNFRSFTGTFGGAKTYVIGRQSLFIYGISGGLYSYDFSGETATSTRLVQAKATNVQKTPTGFFANFAGLAYYYSVDATGTTATKEASAISCASADPTGDGTVWITDVNGLHIKGSTDYYKINSLTFDEPFWLRYNGVLNKLYVGVSAPNKVTTNSDYTIPNVINTYNGMTWTNATPYGTSGSGYSGYEFVFNPKDPHTYLRTSWTRGIFKVTDDVRKLTYTSSNSLIGGYKPSPAFDKYGNLWVVSPYHAAANSCAVLTADKVAKNSVAKTDWFVPSGLNLTTESFQRSRFIVASKNNYKIFSDCDFITGSVVGHVLVWDNGNEDPLDDTYQFNSIGHFVDQNNGLVEWQNLSLFEEDRDGLIWVGHTMGLFIIDPVNLFDQMPRVTRPYSSKFSEGKGYIFEGYTVYDIGVDKENKKWIATNNGLYFISPDADEVYNHFTIENSDIPSNTVYSVECDTVNDRVYIYTDNGFAEYVPEGDAAAINFDNVYAFPNPVEPDFTGMIKITNLMDNSYVTVTDHNGAVVAQFGPVMGSAFWDGSGANGERVATGLYNIYAAQGAYPATSGTPQATVMIIK